MMNVFDIVSTSSVVRTARGVDVYIYFLKGLNFADTWRSAFAHPISVWTSMVFERLIWNYEKPRAKVYRCYDIVE
jgi:hypothetical protein